MLLKDIFAGYRILDWFFFSVITLKMLFYSLLTFIVSNEKSVNNWIVVLLYKIYHFLFLLSKFAHYTWLLILTLAPDFWVWLWCLAILLDVHRVGWICKFMYFIKFGKCLVITSSNSSCLFFFLSSFWDSDYNHILPLDIL